MGLHYSERKYYDDPEENERFINIYGPTLYCKHGQSRSHTCYRCKHEYREALYEQYCNRHKINFMKYFNKQYNYYFNDPSLQTPKDVEIRVDDKFYKLKKSNSQEELKKNYFKLAKKYHPDKPSGSTKLFQKLHQIYTALKPTLI